jgi:ABC-type antimicrobial peptide transport system permease subunit
VGPFGPFTIVGVVGDVHQLSLAAPQPFAVYLPSAQWAFAENAMSLVIRASGAPMALAPAIRDAVWSVDRDQPIVRTAELAALVRASAGERRFALIVFGSFALAALLLAACGIYGVLAGSVAERTREIGVRAALGASRSRIVALVVGQGLGLTVLGVVIGVAGSVVASRALISLLFGVSRLDPRTYGATIVLLVAIALTACAIPAWRAARVDPATTLRSD